MGKGKDRRLVLRRAAIGAAFTVPLVLAGCGIGGGDIPKQCLKDPLKCLEEHGNPDK